MIHFSNTVLASDIQWLRSEAATDQEKVHLTCKDVNVEFISNAGTDAPFG
jgi:hypothetical protein